MTVVCLSRTVHFLQQYPSFVRLLQHTLLFSYFFEKCRPAQQTPKVGSMLDQRRGQHWTKFGWMSRVCWVGTKLVCLPTVFSFKYKAKEIAESLIGDNTTTGEIYINLKVALMPYTTRKTWLLTKAGAYPLSEAHTPLSFVRLCLLNCSVVTW